MQTLSNRIPRKDILKAVNGSVLSQYLPPCHGTFEPMPFILLLPNPQQIFTFASIVRESLDGP